MRRPTRLPVTREHTGDRNLDRVQQNIGQGRSKAFSSPFGGWIIKTLRFAAASTYYTFNHGIGVPAACFPVRMNYDAAGGAGMPAFAENISPGAINLNSQISLKASAVCTVDMLFYPRASKVIPTGKIQSA